MRSKPKKKKAAFSKYPEVRAVAAMSDEELRLALAEYGMKPLTRLPDVLQSLATDNERFTIRALLPRLGQAVGCLLRKPPLLRELTALALLLVCFGLMIVQCLRVPLSSIAPVALHLSGDSPPRAPKRLLMVVDASNSMRPPTSIAKTLRPKLEYPLLHFYTHGLTSEFNNGIILVGAHELSPNHQNFFNPFTQKAFCNNQTCHRPLDPSEQTSSVWHSGKWDTEYPIRRDVSAEMDHHGALIELYERLDKIELRHARLKAALERKLYWSEWDVTNQRLLRTFDSLGVEYSQRRIRFESSILSDHWRVPSKAKYGSPTELPGYHSIRFQVSRSFYLDTATRNSAPFEEKEEEPAPDQDDSGNHELVKSDDTAGCPRP